MALEEDQRVASLQVPEDVRAEAAGAMTDGRGRRGAPAGLPVIIGIALVTLITIVTGGQAQDAGFHVRDFANPVPYAPGFQPPFERRPFIRDVHHQSLQQQSFQGPFQSSFQGPFQPPFQPTFQTKAPPQDHFAHFARNASGFQVGPAGPLQVTRFQPLPPEQGDFPRLFQDPQFEQLFQQELNHQLQLEQMRLQDQQQKQRHQQQQQQQQQFARRPESQVLIQQSHAVQVERPQLQELHELHSLLEQQLQLHEVRQKEERQQRQQQQQLQQMVLLQQQQHQQQNLVDSHEVFMSQKIKPQLPTPPREPKLPLPQKTTQKPSTTTTPKSQPLEVIDLSQFLPFLQQQQQLQQQQNPQSQKEEDKQLESDRLQQQRLRQQLRHQETLRQQEERRLQEQRLKERQRQQRQQLQQQQQRLQEQEKRQRQQRQQPANNTTAGRPATEKQVTSVRDLFNTTSCIEPPLTCPHPRIHFYLYTRTTQENGQRVDVTKPESLLSTPFNPKHPIKVLIHGFQGGRQFSPSTDLRKAYFIRGDYNIFVVDYQTLVRLPCLSQIQWSPSFLALCVSQLVSYVGTTTKGAVPPDRFHLIGYSIGAHIAGLVANYVDRDKGKLGRITGLDPTIIFYQGTNRSHDLDPSDAHFIDVIHTGAGILGQRGPNGHVDYYVNGGTTQPGCQSDSLIKTLSCDHTKVSPYYVESIVTPVGFWALPCPNLFMYLLGFCQPKDEDYILMGEDAPHTARGIYYLSTNANKPFAKGFPGKRMPIKFPKWRPT